MYSVVCDSFLMEAATKHKMCLSIISLCTLMLYGTFNKNNENML